MLFDPRATRKGIASRRRSETISITSIRHPTHAIRLLKSRVPFCETIRESRAPTIALTILGMLEIRECFKQPCDEFQKTPCIAICQRDHKIGSCKQILGFLKFPKVFKKKHRQLQFRKHRAMSYAEAVTCTSLPASAGSGRK